jgi:hypothetical protein
MNSNTPPVHRAVLFGRVVSPWQFLALAVFSFLGLSCGILWVLSDWPSDSIGHRVCGVTTTISVLIAPTVCIGAFFELLRRGRNWRLLLSGLIAASGLVIFIAAIHFRFSQFGL